VARGQLFSGRIRNVSVTGAFVETRHALPLLSLVHVALVPSQPEDEPPQRVAAWVVRHCPNGIGLEWCDLSGQARERILRWERESGGATASKATIRADAHR